MDNPVADKDYFLDAFPSLQIYEDIINKQKKDIVQCDNHLVPCTITSNHVQIASSNNDIKINQYL